MPAAVSMAAKVPDEALTYMLLTILTPVSHAPFASVGTLTQTCT